ncbi:hypothetical protein [Paracoccus sanguinis]|uniref:hypothetical protein n=1 Tax=Paracoccus sanguinis TaxID=1545044 RepID=UPI0012E077DB|nr:hypothetical protein [Paracoccus sanguinis]
MASRSVLFKNIPIGAVREAAESCCSAPGYSMGQGQDENLIVINNSSGRRRQTFKIGLTEGAAGTTVSVSGPDKEEIGAIVDRLSIGVNNIRAQGRIAPRTYQLGQATPAKSEKESSGNWLFGFIFVGLFTWIINSESGQSLLADLFKRISTPADISSYSCDEVAELVTGKELQNALGGRFEIIEVTGLRQINKDGSSISCSGTVSLSNGTEQEMSMTVSKRGSSGQIRYEVRPL